MSENDFDKFREILKKHDEETEDKRKDIPGIKTIRLDEENKSMTQAIDPNLFFNSQKFTQMRAWRKSMEEE